MKTITINGGLRAKNDRNIVLTLYSTPLARFLIDKEIKQFNIEYDHLTKKFIIEKGNQRKISIERKNENHPLCILHVSRILGRNLPKELKKDRKTRKVEVILKNILSDKDMIKYNNLISYTEPDYKISTIIPEPEVVNLACHISCFRNKNSFCYRLTIRHKILEEIAIKKEKIMILRDKEGNFILKKNGFGRTFNLHKSKKGHPVIYMQISPSLIKEEENELFKNGRRSFSSRIIFSEKEFNLDISKHFSVREERELAYALVKQNINIRIPQMGKREADIVIKDSNAQIEITNLKPSKINRNKNNAHGEGAHINARLCEGFLRVTKNIVPYYFLIINKGWSEYRWVKETCNLIQPNVVTIYTDFSGDWAGLVAKEILHKIKLFGKNDN